MALEPPRRVDWSAHHDTAVDFIRALFDGQPPELLGDMAGAHAYVCDLYDDWRPFAANLHDMVIAEPDDARAIVRAVELMVSYGAQAHLPVVPELVEWLAEALTGRVRIKSGRGDLGGRDMVVGVAVWESRRCYGIGAPEACRLVADRLGEPSGKIWRVWTGGKGKTGQRAYMQGDDDMGKYPWWEMMPSNRPMYDCIVRPVLPQ